MKQKNYNIPTVVYFVVTALLIAYFFPERENSVISSTKASLGGTDCSPPRAISRSTRPTTR